MSKKIKLTEKQVNMIQITNLIENNNGGKKKVKLTESQLARIVKFLKEGEDPESTASKGMGKLFKQAVPKIKVEGEIPRGHHPLMDASYIPQSEKQNRRTFNEDEDKINNVIYSNLNQLLKDVVTNQYVTIDDIEMPSYLEDVGFNVEDLKTSGLITFDENGIIRVTRENWKLKLREIADELRGNVINGKMKKDISVDEDLIGPNVTSIPDRNLTPQDVKYREPIVSKNNRFSTIYINNSNRARFAILTDKLGRLYYFSYHHLTDDELLPYSEAEEIDTKEFDDDGNPQFDYGEFEVDKALIERYVNDNITDMTKGVGYSGISNGKDIVKLNKAAAIDLLDTYNEDEHLRTYIGKLTEDGEGGPMGGQGGTMGGTPMSGGLSIGAGTTAKDGGPYETTALGTSSIVKKKMFPESAIKIEEMGEGGPMGGQGGIGNSGAVETPLMFSKSKKGRLSKETMYKGGKFVPGQ